MLNLALEEMAGPRPLENHLSVLAEHPTLTVLQTTETKSKIKSESDRGKKSSQINMKPLIHKNNGAYSLDHVNKTGLC